MFGIGFHSTFDSCLRRSVARDIVRFTTAAVMDRKLRKRINPNRANSMLRKWHCINEMNGVAPS